MSNPNDSTPTKRCTKCGVEKLYTLEFFSRDGDKLSVQCKKCSAARAAAYRETHPRYDAENKRKWAQDHRDRMREFGKRAYRRNKQTAVARDREQLKLQNLKRCARCGEVYPPATEHFYTRDGGKSLSSICKACARQTAAKWRQDHLEVSNERNRKKNNERYWADPKKYAEFGKRSREKHRERIKAWKRDNRATSTAAKVRYIAKKHQLAHSFTAQDWRQALDYFGNCCAVCGRPRGLWHTLAADHWIPIASPECPGTVPTNIIPLCHGEDGCNNHKRNQQPMVWLVRQFGERKAKQIEKRIQTYFDSLKDGQYVE